MSRDTLGEFEQLVLLACLRLKANAHTVPILQEIRDRTGRDPSHAAVYVALKRLEQKGLVRAEPATPRRGGRSRQRYRVERQALAMLRESRDALLSMWDGVEPLRS